MAFVLMDPDTACWCNQNAQCFTGKKTQLSSLWWPKRYNHTLWLQWRETNPTQNLIQTYKWIYKWFIFMTFIQHWFGRWLQFGWGLGCGLHINISLPCSSLHGPLVTQSLTHIYCSIFISHQEQPILVARCNLLFFTLLLFLVS